MVHYFTGGTGDGEFPASGLTLVGSTFYGTTGGGGSANQGTVFSIGTDGSGFNVLHSFTGGTSDGASPQTGLTLVGSTLFGTTSQGGSANDGTVFSIDTDGSGFDVAHSFAGGTIDGSRPVAGLTLVGSTLYGTTRVGGSANDGTVFSISTDGSGYTVLHSLILANGDGQHPDAGLTLVGSTLYGTTVDGGSVNAGTVFSISTDGSGYTVLHSFLPPGFGAPDGWDPVAGLTLVGSTLYGTTLQGGSSSDGTVFSIHTDGSGYTLRHSFARSDGFRPEAGLTLVGSTLYGTTFQGGSALDGTVFSITINAPVVTLSPAGVTFTNAGPVAIGSASTITDSGSANLNSLTVTLANPQAGDMLSDSVAGTSISSSFYYDSFTTTDVLTLSGSDTLAHYQQVLRTVTYNNTTGSPGVATETVSVAADDGTNNSTAALATININVTTSPSSVSAVKLFYDNSQFNKNVEGVGTGTNDDKAIDTTKTAYLPGAGTANFSNVSAYTDGINGIMVDLATGGVHGSLNASDFTFRVGINNSPSLWASAPTPSTISVRTGSPAAGNDRVELTWTDGSIKQEFLEVTVHADPNTGLSAARTRSSTAA